MEDGTHVLVCVIRIVNRGSLRLTHVDIHYPNSTVAKDFLFTSVISTTTRKNLSRLLLLSTDFRAVGLVVSRCRPTDDIQRTPHTLPMGAVFVERFKSDAQSMITLATVTASAQSPGFDAAHVLAWSRCQRIPSL
jgi:hypothetical protein